MELRVIESDEGGNLLSGYPVRFNTWSEDLGGFIERVRPEAVKNALMVSDIRMLYGHNSDSLLPLGRSNKKSKTLRFATDTRGIKIENELPDIQIARELKISINRKDVDGMSFGFTVSDSGDEWNEKDGIVRRTINEIKEFFDFSVVVYPAYTATKVSVRALDKAKEIKQAATSLDDTEATLRAQQDEGKSLEIDILNITRTTEGNRKC